MRGKGSGFLEGPVQKESNDPLNLCVSSKDNYKYKLACHEVEKLLIKVYGEYQMFYKGKHCKKFALFPLKIQKVETMTGPKSIFEQQQSTIIKKDGCNYEMVEQD